MEISAQSSALAQDLLAFIDASPSPWHAVQTVAERLRGAGFVPLREDERWQLAAGGRYYVVRGGASIIAFVAGSAALSASGFRLVGAHTDSPGLRLKPRALQAGDGLLRLGVEVYGGPILATFADRDLGLAGRVAVRGVDSPVLRLVRFGEPLLRLPNLAIHMNREVNENGLKFNKQTELPLVLGLAGAGKADEGCFRALLAARLAVAPDDILSWELNAYDTQPGAFWGASKEFVADGQLDNLASCHAGLCALLAADSPRTTNVCAFFDHEEVGSESATGAGGSFVADVLRRVAASLGLDDESYRCALARSFVISADMAHAYHPNFPNAYEPAHRVAVNGGPVIKINANQRYSTGADSAARFILFCEKAGVPYQHYAHRTDLGCGSTIGPIVAAGLGVASVDVGSPMWAMHSARESAGVLDHGYMIGALSAAFSD
ncbi:M18 family aminopeptidase [Dechloromonas sp. H13]|uniref:M18 family aminopeptidase n=1 Tax=Dechloromonas sp. H13 TaxID=2570193 RepID=UPI0012917678|nr:M18 family aminopeptidase [Dechloromonas sp. H13]